MSNINSKHIYEYVQSLKKDNLKKINENNNYYPNGLLKESELSEIIGNNEFEELINNTVELFLNL